MPTPKKSKIPERFYNNHKLCHVLKVFKDGKTEIILYKYWGRKSRMWFYQCETRWEFDTAIECGVYSLKRTPRSAYKPKLLFNTL